MGTQPATVRVLALAGLLAVVGGVAGTVGPATLASQQQAPPIDFKKLCDIGNHYYVAAVSQRHGWSPSGDHTVVAFRDSPGPWDGEILAREAAVGNVYGLAYDWRHAAIFAASYIRRGTESGPGGPGAIYKLDLATRQISAWLTVDVGIQAYDPSTWTQDLVGRVGIADIDVSSDSTELLIANMSTGRILRRSLPDGADLGSFRHGAAEAPWSADARLFGLGVHDGALFHGVVDTRASSPMDAPRLHIYRSQFDGSLMKEVLDVNPAEVSGVNWKAWGPDKAWDAAMLSDIEFDHRGNMIIGLRNRVLDVRLYEGTGDILLATRDNQDQWSVKSRTSFYHDRLIKGNNFQGGLAASRDRTLVVAGAERPFANLLESGAIWFSNLNGRVGGFRDGRQLLVSDENIGIGDIEALCIPNDAEPTPRTRPSATPTPTATPSPTSSPTGTPTPSRTATPSPTSTALPTETPLRLIYLPILGNRWCQSFRPPLDIVLVVDLSTSMLQSSRSGQRKIDDLVTAMELFMQAVFASSGPRGGDRVGVVGFNQSATILCELTDDRDRLSRVRSDLINHLREGSRLDLALSESRLALAVSRSPSVPVVILLTDGLPNQVPTPIPAGSMEDTVLARSRELKAGGVVVYTIGIGRDDSPEVLERINAVLLRAIASDPEHYFQSDDAGTLGQIYLDIAARLVNCDD
jgi:hypothetical protein